jgi:uncharacterized coiled-coil DUF342 family protein
MAKRQKTSDELAIQAKAKEFVRKAKPLLNQLSKCRDDLRSLVSEYEEIAESSDEAFDALERAVDSMSRFI